MTERTYCIIVHENVSPIGETLFRGTYEEAQSYAKEIGNSAPSITKAEINNNKFVKTKS